MYTAGAQEWVDGYLGEHLECSLSTRTIPPKLSLPLHCLLLGGFCQVADFAVG